MNNNLVVFSNKTATNQYPFDDIQREERLTRLVKRLAERAPREKRVAVISVSLGDSTETIRSQEYYWTPQWQAAEAEADEDIRNGRLHRFDSLTALVDWLESPE